MKKAVAERRTCLQVCVAILEYADNTERQLRQKLAERGFPPEEIDAAVTTVKAKRLFSEQNYAGRYALLCAKKNWGPRRILLSMREKGFREENISAVDAAMKAAMTGAAGGRSPDAPGAFSAIGENAGAQIREEISRIDNSDIENLLYSLDFISSCAILIRAAIHQQRYRRLRTWYEEGELPEGREARMALQKERQRLYAALFRRGFDMGTIRDAEDVVRENPADEE